MSFEVTAEAYGAFMGRYSLPLATVFADRVGVRAPQRALDVGCGPGALTGLLVDRLGSGAVSAIDPSESFVAAMHARFPDVDVRAGVAEQLPFPDDTFDVALAQLVVHFMDDPVAGLIEMSRVTRPDGVVAACVWDHGGDGGPLATFWRGVHDVDPDEPGEARYPGTREGHLAELFEAAGLSDVEQSSLTVHVPFASYDEWWEPYTLGVGPAGAYVARIDKATAELLRVQCQDLLPPAPFEIAASAWCVRGSARG